jgi:uncharacterized protein YndB with AHSA1/START domain
MTGTHAVEVSVHVAATPEDVFPYFTDPARYVQWMGIEAKLDPVPGGVYHVQMPDGFRAAGTFLEIDPPHQLAFTWDSPTRRRPSGPSTSRPSPAAATPCRPGARASR